MLKLYIIKPILNFNIRTKKNLDSKIFTYGILHLIGKHLNYFILEMGENKVLN